MPFGPRVCACCGEIFGVEAHHLYSRKEGCPDDLTVWLCNECHGRAHQMKRRINIRLRIIEGLAAAKARGVKLGRDDIGDANRDAAAARDAELKPILQGMLGQSSRAIAAKLTAMKIEAPRGGAWSQKTVLRVLARLGL